MKDQLRTPNELASGLELILAENREALTVREIDLLEETIQLLQELDNPKIISRKSEMISLASDVLANLLRLLSKTEIISEISKIL